MKILVTGSSGFVGTNLVSKLSKKHKIVKYDLVDGQNILDTKLLSRKMRGVDLVIHLAAFISASESWEKPKEYFENNVLGTVSVLETMKKEKVGKMIFFSSAAAIATPMTPYGLTKKTCEAVMDLYKNAIKSIIIRPENIYGKNQKANYGYVIHNFINAVRMGRPVIIYGDGKQSRDFVYVDDVVDTVDHLIKKNIYEGTISVGTGKSTSVLKLAKLISKALNKELKIEHYPEREEPKKSVANLKGLQKLGIPCCNFISLDEGVIKLHKDLDK